MYQQGDLLIQKITDEIKGKPLSHRILARGEVTSHTHRVSNGDVELYEQDGVLYLRVNSSTATVTHEEHRPITLPQGDFIIRRVREYDHFEEEARTVRD